jgi:adenylosuccinate lyase
VIARYNIKEMELIWSDQNRFEKMLDVEISLLKSLEKFEIIPHGIAKKFSQVRINPERISEIEMITRHDVIAFCTSITEQVEENIAKFFHFGVTSSDILDTALSLQLRDSIQLLLNDISKLLSSLKHKILETKNLLAIGRSHGMNAEPLVFAQKFLSIYEELKRRQVEYQRFLKENLTGQFSGAVGNYTILSIEIENHALNLLGLKRESVTTQVISRDHIAKLISIGSLLASLLERFSTEIRLLHHSDIAEVSEGFQKGQKGSSTMPHKKNPISSENISGLSRVIRSHFDIALQNTNLWHERDISHSSAERLMLPDHFGLLSYILRRTTSLVSNLEINRERISSKLNINFSYLSSFVLHQLILVNNCSREKIYEIVQTAAFTSKDKDNFLQNLKNMCQVNQLIFPSDIDTEQLEKKYIEKFDLLLEELQFN